MRFLAELVAARRVVVIRPPGARVDAGLSHTAAGLRVTAATDAAEAAGSESAEAIPADADLLFVQPGASLRSAPPLAVVWAARAHDVELPAGHWSAVLALSAGRDAESGALWVPGLGPAADAVAEAEAVDAESRAESPRDPTPPAARHALFALARASRRRAALEVGTGDGAATLFLGEALRQNGGRVLTVERDSARYARAVRHVARAGLAGFVDLRLGEAERVVPRLDESYDLVVLDASPSDRVEHLALVEGACRRGAVIVSCGAAAHASELATYQATVRTHPLVVGEATVPVGDGLGLALLARRPSKRPVDHRA